MMDAFIEQLRDEIKKEMRKEGTYLINYEVIDTRMAELATKLHKLLTEKE